MEATLFILVLHQSLRISAAGGGGASGIVRYLIYVQLVHTAAHMLNKPTDYIASLVKGLKVIEAFGAASP